MITCHQFQWAQKEQKKIIEAKPIYSIGVIWMDEDDLYAAPATGTIQEFEDYWNKGYLEFVPRSSLLPGKGATISVVLVLQETYSYKGGLEVGIKTHSAWWKIHQRDPILGGKP